MRDSELRLLKDIEVLRREGKEAELGLRKEIKEVELSLQKEIKEVELRLTREIAQTKADLLKWIVPLMIGQIAAIAALVKLL